ncbi:MAG TPA: hypothetical protein EYG79_04120 [Rhodobacteraceae bacterium]|nr:hypothetical protein [Paracoccaceae bacterium]
MRAQTNPLHPALLRLEADVIEAAPLDAVLNTHPKSGFTCTISEGDIRAAKLLATRNFTPVRRTVEGGWQGDPSAALPQLSYGTLAERPDLTKAWLAAHRQHYFSTHAANPPAALAAHSWDEVFLGKDFSPESAFYILDKNGIAAFSSLRKTAARWELAWFGTVPDSHSAFARLNTGLIAQETAFMAANGISEVLGEFDSTNPDAMWRVKHSAPTCATVFQTYHLKR